MAPDRSDDSNRPAAPKGSGPRQRIPTASVDPGPRPPPSGRREAHRVGPAAAPPLADQQPDHHRSSIPTPLAFFTKNNHAVAAQYGKPLMQALRPGIPFRLDSA